MCGRFHIYPLRGGIPQGFPRENSRDRNEIRVPGTCGKYVEHVLICISLNVFKSRKVCRIIRESVSFFPPLF